MKRAVAVVVAVFVLSRLFFLYVVGVTFDSTTLDGYWQYINPNLLRNDLLQSLYYLHSQPPLYNLFLGVVLRLFPGSETIAFQIIYLFFGLSLAVFLLLLMVRLGVNTVFAATLTIIFIISPAAVIYENWLFYDYPLATMLCVSAFALHKFVASSKARYALLFFAFVAGLILVRSLFHIFWIVFILLSLLWFKRDQWRKILGSAAVPLLLVFLLYAKNLYVFGMFSSSSWLGLSLWKMTINQLAPTEVQALVDAGKLDRISQIGTFSKVDAYKPLLSNIPITNVPVLDQEVKPNGLANFNHIAYIAISRQYLKDAMYVLRQRPDAYWKGVQRSYYLYLQPPTDYFVFFRTGIRNRLQAIDEIYNLLFYGQVIYNKDDPRHVNVQWSRIGFFLPIIFLLSFIYGAYVLVKGAVKNLTGSPFYITVGFIWVALIYVTLVGNSLEEGENNRFRFMIDPLFLVMLSLVVSRMVSVLKPHLFQGYHDLRGSLRSWATRELKE